MSSDAPLIVSLYTDFLCISRGEVVFYLINFELINRLFVLLKDLLMHTRNHFYPQYRLSICQFTRLSNIFLNLS